MADMDIEAVRARALKAIYPLKAVDTGSTTPRGAPGDSSVRREHGRQSRMAVSPHNKPSFWPPAETSAFGPASSPWALTSAMSGSGGGHGPAERPGLGRKAAKVRRPPEWPLSQLRHPEAAGQESTQFADIVL
jgi:hypothetical protein